MRLDVGTAAAQPIDVRVGGVTAAITNECFGFAPNGQRYLVKDAEGRLLAADPTGAAVVVDAPKRQTYVEIGGARRTEAVSTVECGRWLDDQRIVFDHLRALPSTLTGDTVTGPQMTHSAKDTALAVLTGAGVRLVESVTRWRVVGTCGLWTPTRRGGDAYTPDTFLWKEVPEQALAVDGADHVRRDVRAVRRPGVPHRDHHRLGGADRRARTRPDPRHPRLAAMSRRRRLANDGRHLTDPPVAAGCSALH